MSAEAEGGVEANRQVRGSTALLLGRGISLVVNFGTKILIVRWLTKAEFGAFAYGFAMVPVARTLVALGQTQTISRFLSIFEEGGEDDKLVGTVLVVAGVITLLGLALVGTLVALRDAVLAPWIGDPTAVVALTIVAALGPIDALDKTWEGVLAVLASPSEIFVRRYVVGPVFLVLAIVSTLAAGGGAVALATAHVVAAGLTTIVSAGLGVRAMRRRGILQRARRTGLRFPVRELYSFSTPLVMTELLPIALGPVAVAVLGWYGSTSDVASYRAVYPLARFNQTVIFTFTILYVPLASRMYARRDRAGAADAYWQTASWLLALSLPGMIATLAFAEPVTVLLFGEAYRSSAPILVILSLGYLANLSTGFNAQTLQVQGQVRYLVGSSVVAALASVSAIAGLGRMFGPVGVAAGVAIGLTVQNGLNHAGLVRHTGIPGMTPLYGRMVAGSALLVGTLAAWQALASPPLWLGLAVGGVGTVLMFVAARRGLRLGETFPELRRVPGLGRIIG